MIYIDKMNTLICINSYIIEGVMNIKNLNNFDIIFNKLSNDNVELDVMIFHIWNGEKRVIRNYPKDKYLKIISYINIKLITIQNNLIENNMGELKDKIKSN